MKRWQLQEAKAQLSRVVRSSNERGPQEITVHGRTAAVVVSKEEFDRLTRRTPGFIAFLRRSPLVGVNLRVTRDRSRARDVVL